MDYLIVSLVMFEYFAYKSVSNHNSGAIVTTNRCLQRILKKRIHG